MTLEQLVGETISQWKAAEQKRHSSKKDRQPTSSPQMRAAFNKRLQQDQADTPWDKMPPTWESRVRAIIAGKHKQHVEAVLNSLAIAADETVTSCGGGNCRWQNYMPVLWAAVFQPEMYTERQRSKARRDAIENLYRCAAIADDSLLAAAWSN